MEPSAEELRREKLRIDDRAALDRKLQLLLGMQYADRLESGKALPSFADTQFRTFSQNGEDGILHYIFSLIGHGGRRCVEICAADGIECNSANLIINHGWRGLLVEGRAEYVRRGIALYNVLADTFIHPPAFVHAWVTPANVNDLIRREGFAGDVDLLSLDLDGIDYWVWQSIDCIRPRVVIAEYNGLWSAAHAVTIPNDPHFQMDFSRVPFYHGASLAALVKLGREKGYRLV